MSRVERIICYSAKGMPGQSMEKVNLIKDCGMLGDYHATGGERQITLISIKAKDWILSQETEGLCFAKFNENIVVKDMILEALPEQAVLRIGEAVLELSPIRKKCYPQLCKLAQNKEECVMSQEVRFAKVITGGDISVEMDVVVCGG